MRQIDQFESKDELISELTHQIKELEYKFMDEKQELHNKILKLERQVEVERGKFEEIQSRYSNVKKDMNLIEKINEKQNQELENETAKEEIVDELKAKIRDLTTKLENNMSELMKEKDKTLDLKLELREKELELRREEVRSDELTKEIEFLELKVQEWEEKYDNDKIQGNAHIGLSRIDFMAVNAIEKTSQRNSLKKSYLYASVFNGGNENKTNKKKPSNPKSDSISRDNSVKSGSVIIQQMDNLQISEASRHLESSDYTELGNSKKIDEQKISNFDVNVPPTPNFESSIKKKTGEINSPLRIDTTEEVNYRVRVNNNNNTKVKKSGKTNNFKKKKPDEAQKIKVGSELDEDEKPIPIFGGEFKSNNPSFGGGFGGFESQIVITEPTEKDSNEKIERNFDNFVPDSLAESAIVNNDLASHHIFTKNRNIGASEKPSIQYSSRNKGGIGRKTFDLTDRFSARSSRKSGLSVLNSKFYK